MASWCWGDPVPTSEENTAVNGRDFTVVDLPTDKNDERKYGTRSPEPTEHHTRKDLRANPYAPERLPFQGRPREVPCLQCASRMIVGGFRFLCCDHLADPNGKCYFCVLHGVECEEVPDNAFKSAYELQVCARKMDEGHEDVGWSYLSGRVEVALMNEGLFDYWDGSNHVKEVTNDKANHVENGKYYWNDGTAKWSANDNDHVTKAVNHKVNGADKGEPYWDDDNTSWSDKDIARWNDYGDVNVNANANANQVDNDNTNLSDNGVPRWGSNQESAWDDQDDTNWASNGKGKGWRPESTSDSEVDNDCDEDSNGGRDIQYTPESSTDQIVSAINRNTDVVAELCEIMDGIKWGLDRLHKDNVQSKEVLEKLLNERGEPAVEKARQGPVSDRPM
ncbi:hypothetical protein CDV31_011131 [Fusarium ambrosium]|uniref:Uncharacterized protein n=1 Tax=Fusarium ambrosium TaxID=131363 RepID=A0A428TIY5_9HYPO|nr:hypothetical protein CDV31_011131 [Fusarium ambrosium]